MERYESYYMYGLCGITYAYFVANFWSFESVNVNENDDEVDSEDVDIQENPLDESELIHDYKIESLQLYDSGKTWSSGGRTGAQNHGNPRTGITKPHLTDNISAYEWLLKSADEYCFISVIGKSRFGKSLSQVLLPLLRPKRDFRRIAYFDECGIDFYWSGLWLLPIQGVPEPWFEVTLFRWRKGYFSCSKINEWFFDSDWVGEKNQFRTGSMASDSPQDWFRSRTPRD